MIPTTPLLGLLALTLAFMALVSTARAAIDPEDQKLIDAASCEEIQREYRNYVIAERELYDRIRSARAGTAAANVAGIAAFFALGFGFITWDDNSDAEEALAEVREIRVAIEAGARKKACPI
jgi:hypothetical protein